MRVAQGKTSGQADGSSRFRFEQANEESGQQDQLDEGSVNRDRLRHRGVVSDTASVDTAGLDASVNAVISQNPDIVFGISIIDLSIGSVHDYGNNGPMTAASVTKVLTAVDYLKQVELGNKSLSITMSNGLTAQDNIEQMIVVSDNDAWRLLNDYLGYSQMQEYAHSIGLTSYSYSDNTISSAHTAKLLGDLYTNKLIDASHTELLLSYMARANYRDLIIPAVPPHDTVYHKAGEYLATLNDAAIITNGSRSIVLSIYTESNSGYDKPRVAALMQQITAPALQTFGLQ
jgi:beta-lactamase class A